MRLDLGGGYAPVPGHLNIDIIPEADIRFNLNNGLPLEPRPHSLDEIKDHRLYPNSVDGIRCHHLIEHLDTIIPLMNDSYEVMKSGSIFEISTPYANTIQALQDPTHKRMGFVCETFLYFCQNSPFEKEQKEYGITARFMIVKNERGQGTDNWQLFVTFQK